MGVSRWERILTHSGSINALYNHTISCGKRVYSQNYSALEYNLSAFYVKCADSQVDLVIQTDQDRKGI